MQGFIQICQLSIGQIEVTKDNVSKYTSSALHDGTFSLVPSHVIEQDISQKDCCFLIKDKNFMTVGKKRPQKILKSSECELAILVFDQSRLSTDQIRKLQVSMCQEILQEGTFRTNLEVRLYGYSIENKIMSQSPTFDSRRKNICCRYEMVIDNDLNYTCEENLDGFVGAAISMEGQTWIGVHDSGIKDQFFGIIFTKDIVQGLIKMVEDNQQRNQALKQLPNFESSKQIKRKFDMNNYHMYGQDTYDGFFEEIYKEMYQIHYLLQLPGYLIDKFQCSNQQ